MSKQQHKIVVVLLYQPGDKHHIKSVIDEKIAIPSQFVITKTAQKASGALSVAGNILKQMNAKVMKDLYRISHHGTEDTMVVGVNAVNSGKGMIFALVATINPYLTQCFTYIDKIVLPKEYFGSRFSKT